MAQWESWTSAGDACNARNAGDTGSVPGLGGSPGGENSNLLLYSCLENSMDRIGWWASVHWVSKSWTWLSNWAWTFIYQVIWRYTLFFLRCEIWMSVKEEITAPAPSQKCNKIEDLKLILDVWLTDWKEKCELSLPVLSKISKYCM